MQTLITYPIANVADMTLSNTPEKLTECPQYIPLNF